MKKSIFLFFAAILCAMNASAYKLYLYTGKVGWQDGNAKFQVWTNKNVNATKIGNNWYSFDVGTYSGTAYIKRNNPSGGTWDEFSVSISSTDNFARVTDWKKGEISSLHVTGDNWNGIENWSSNNAAGKMTIDGNTFTKTFENVSAEAHKFKLTFKGTWDNAIGHGDHVSCVNGTVKGVDGNIEFTPKVAGNVTITYDMADGKIVITCATPKYTIATSANPAEGGTVTGGGTYEEGASVTLTATPNTGYEFENWTEGGSVVSNSATLEFNISKDRTLVANFKVPVPDAVKYQVNVSANDNVMGIVTGGGEYEENATAILNATPNAGYQFVNWTVGGEEKSTNTTYSFIVTEAVEVVANFKPIPTTTVYLVNNSNWTRVYAYGWKNGEAQGTPAWPGAEITANKLAEKYEGYDVYSYNVKEGSYDNVIFNNNSGKQTETFAWIDGKYYYAVDPLGSDVYLAGEMTNWDTDKVEFKKETAEGTIASVTVNLTAKSYTFQLVIDGTWYGNKSTMKRGGDAVHEGGWSFKDTSYGANCTIVADFPGDYTFTWNLETEKLTVTYPELPTYTVTATAENGTVTGAGEYKHGTEATLVATPNTGYAFVNWKKGEEVVSSEASYTFTVTANTDLVAVFAPEETHEVTVSYICNSTPIPGHDAHTLAVGVTTPSTITAPAITNYTFNGWTLGSGVQAVDANANPIQITTKAEGEYTLTANYTKIELTYTVTVPAGTEKCYIAGEMTSWSFQEMTPTANANEFTITIDGATTAHKYKYACGDGWAYVEKKADGSELDADRTYNANDVVAKWAEPAKCYLMGIGGDWTTGIEMEEDGDQFKLLCQPIAEGEQFKFKYGDTWTTDVENYDANGVGWVESYPGSGQYNITLPAGNYDFYYKKNENKVWIEVCTPATPETYTRATTAGKFGTICLPYASASTTGAIFYEVSYLVAGTGLWLDQLADGAQLEAGKPYIFKATADEITVTYTGEEKAAPVAGASGLTGTFENIADGSLENHYIISNNQVWVAAAGATLSANRAYIDATKVPTTAQAQLPGRRRVCMGENATTGLDNITNGEDTTIKVIENGQLIIIRNGEKFNAQGVRF